VIPEIGKYYKHKMKKYLPLLFIVFSTIIYAQDSVELQEVNYAGQIIKLKENCSKNSETEVWCYGSSTLWRYLENEMEGMGKIITEQLLSQYQNDPNFIEKTEIKMNSFGSELKGYKFQFLSEDRSEEHTSELQSRENLVCRLLL